MGIMPRPKVAKSKRPEAERAAEHYLFNVLNCDPKQICRAVRTRFQRQDLWACDVMGRSKYGLCFYAQATAGQNAAVSTRRRKIEKISWNTCDRVFVLQLVSNPNPANARKIDFYFRVHEYYHAKKEWFVFDEAHYVPREWFKKLRVE